MDCVGRNRSVMQSLTEDDEVNALRFDGRILQIAEAKFQVLQTVFLRLVCAEGDDLFRVIDRDDLFAAAREQFAQQTLAGTKVGHSQRRQDAQQQMTERLPGSARAVHTVETTGNLVEIHLRLFVPAREDPFEVELIGGVFVRFLRPAHGQPDEIARDIVGIVVELVKRAFAFSPRLQQAGVLQQTEVRRNARLPHPRDLLQFVHRKVVLLQQCHDPQARRVGQGAERFQSGGHADFS